MMKISFNLILLFGLNLTQWAQAEVIQYTPVESNVAYTKVTSLAFKDADEHISYGKDALQYASLWLPAEGNKKQNNLVVFIHGGCWLNAYDIKHSYALATALAQEGYAVWSLEYRRAGDEGGGWPGSFDDILSGINSVILHTKPAYSLANTVVVGHSAGGHLALLAGSELPELKAVVGLAAITDIVAYSEGQNSCQQATPQFMGGSAIEKPDAYKQANPVNRKMHAQTILLQGGADTIVPSQQASLLEVPIASNALAGHFDWIHPGSAAYQQLLTQLNSIFTQ
jgi:acetyl esterase/lipase